MATKKISQLEQTTDFDGGQLLITDNKGMSKKAPAGHLLRKTAQTLTPEEKAQVQENIDILNSVVGQGMGLSEINKELILVQDDSLISDYGSVQSNSNFSIRKVFLEKGDSIRLFQWASKYLGVICEKGVDAYNVLVKGGASEYSYLAEEDKEIYLTIADTHLINYYHSSISEKAIKSFEDSNSSTQILQKNGWNPAQESIVAVDSFMTPDGQYQGNQPAYDVCRIFIKRGEKVRIKESISQYLAVFARRDRAFNTVITIGSGDKEYEYVSDFDGILIYNRVKGTKLEILSSKVVETAFMGNPLYGKKILCLGDSITEFGLEGMRYSDWIALKTGAIVTNCGIGGTRISSRQKMVDVPTNATEAYAPLDIVNIVDSFVTNDWTKQIAGAKWLKENTEDDNTKIVDTLASLNIKSFDYITIFAGTNDWYPSCRFGNEEPFGVDATLYVNASINRISYQLSQNAPLAKLVAFTPIVRYADQREPSQWSDVYKSRNITLAEFSLREMREWRKNHIPCCDMYYGLGWNQENFPAFFLSSDNVHPFLGFERIADRMIGFLNSSIPNDNEQVDIFSRTEAIYSVLGMTGVYEYPAANLVKDGSAIGAYGAEQTVPSFAIKSIKVKKGDMVRLNQGSSIYISIFAKKNGESYIPLVVGEGKLKVFEYVVDFDGVLYYSHEKIYDDISIVHANILVK